MDKVNRVSSLAELYDGLHGAITTLGRGRSWFVNGAYGSDSDTGTSWATAFKTLTYALSKCTSWYADCIYLANYGPGAESSPIVWNKKGVHVFGCSSDGFPQLIQSDAGGTPAIDFQSNAGGRSSFHNIAFATGSTPTVAAVLMSGTVWNLWFDRCQFGWMGQPAKYGIRTVGDTPELRVTNCKFFHDGITDDAFRIGGSCTRGIINDNVFRIASGKYSITDASGGGALLYEVCRNEFCTLGETEGNAIFLQAGAAIIRDNKAQDDDATADAAQNPFKDSGGTNSWINNWRGDDVTYPAT